MSVKVKGRLLIKCVFADMSRNSSVPRLAQFSQHPPIDPLRMQDHLRADRPVRNIKSEGWLWVY